MPRRVFTYDDTGLLQGYNMASTIGSFVMGVGMLVFLFAIVKGFHGQARRQRSLAGRHARVVHDVPTASTQLRFRPLRHERPPAVRPPPQAEGVRCALSRLAPGPALRLTIAGGAAATAVAVASAALDLGRGHWGAALVALPLLVAAAVIAKLAYPTLLAPTATAVVLLLVAIATGGLVGWTGDARWAVALHVGAGGASFASSLVALAVSRRGERLDGRTLARLRDPDETADHVALAPDRGSRDVRRRRRPGPTGGTSSR